MAVALSDTARTLLDAATYVVLTTLNPDGGPQSSVVWAKRDGDDVLISTVLGTRQKARNVARDPRVSVVGFNPDNPFESFEVRGTATMTEDGGPELIEELSHRYTGGPYTNDPPNARRVVVRITPTRVV